MPSSYDANAIRMLVDTAILAHVGCCIEHPAELDAVAETISHALAEYVADPLRDEMIKTADQ